MIQKKKSISLAGKVSLAVVLIVIFSMLANGLFSYIIYRSDSIAAGAEKAQGIAISVASAFQRPDELRETFDINEKTPYWYEMKAYLDATKARADVQYLYVMDSRYDDLAYYYMEGYRPGDTGTCDFGDEDPLDAFADEMFIAIKTGEPTVSGIYDSGEYGYLVSGFAPILGADNRPVGVVGVDISVNEALAASNSFAVKIILIVLVFSVLFGLFARWYIKREVGRPIAALAETADRIAVGDMDVEIVVRSDDEIGRLVSSFQAMLSGTKEQAEVMQAIANGDYAQAAHVRSDKDIMNQAINNMLNVANDTLSQINMSAKQVDFGAKQIADGAQTLAQGSTEQTNTVQQLSGVVSEITEKTKNNADMARRAATLADTIMQNAEKGNRQMNEMISAVNEINQAGQSIRKVIKTIDDIAFQTNILALNAAVEAARAGQHGKGFAVVADEVRNLAGKSSEAANETGTLLVNSIEKAELGARLAGETAASLAEIVSGIDESRHIVGEIVMLSEEESSGVEQINSGIEQVARVTQQNNATAEENAAASEELSGQADTLERLILQFKLR